MLIHQLNAQYTYLEDTDDLLVDFDAVIYKSKTTLQ
jgi:hypothetical protein